MKSAAHRRALLADPRHVGGRVLHADDIGQLEQPRHGVDRHVDHAPSRDVVDDDRDVGAVVDRLVVEIEPFLRRLVVIGRDHERAIGAGLLGVAGQLDGLGGRVRSGAGDHRHAAGSRLDAELDDLLVLVMGERRRFARRPARHEPVRALVDLPLDQLAGTLARRPCRP